MAELIKKAIKKATKKAIKKPLERTIERANGTITNKYQPTSFFPHVDVLLVLDIGVLRVALGEAGLQEQAVLG